MNESKILIIGANGQLGSALKEKYPLATALNSNELDITNLSNLQKTINWQNFLTIINAAAYTNVDGAETTTGRKIAWQVNGNGPRNLANIATKHNLTLVHISTDYVFDGAEENHLENETFSPLNVYGQSKAAGDIAVSLAPKQYTLRTSWVIGQGKNFVKTMLELATKNIEPKVVSDQIGRLTFTSELVRAIDYLLENSPSYGTYNVSNSGESTSWSNITRAIFKLANVNLKVTDTTTAEYFKDKPGSAPRPLNSTLDLTKIHNTGFKSNTWQDDLLSYIKKENAK